MTAATDPPRCRRQWRAGGLTHICWEPPGHPGDHTCRIGVCAEQPTTTATAQLCGHRWPDTPHPRPYTVGWHRCDEPAGHPAPCTCRCGATTTREDDRDA